jgi:DNA-binding response OmpR family regulator
LLQIRGVKHASVEARPYPDGVVSMNQEAVSAMLVYNQPDHMGELKLLLERQGVKTLVARSCGEAFLHLWGRRSPTTVFTDVLLGDGTWEDLIGIAERSPWAVNVIVVSRLLDEQLYLDTLDRGAFDFLTPPFLPGGVAALLRASTLKAARGKPGRLEARATVDG